MIGLGETGSTDHYGAPGAAGWWEKQWGLVHANADRICALSSFNSSRHFRSVAYWSLDETSRETTALRTAAHRQGHQAGMSVWGRLSGRRVTVAGSGRRC